MTVRMLQGHALDVLAGVPAGSVHCCVCSPPYWQLRDYGTPPQVWPEPPPPWGGGTPPCPAGEHVWMDATVRDGRHRDDFTAGGLQLTAAGSVGHRGAHAGAFCARCRAWIGEWGHEPDPELYVAHTVAVFREVRRVLRDDGTLWLNLGDTYWNDPGGQNGAEGRVGAKAKAANRLLGRRRRTTRVEAGLPYQPHPRRKDLVGVPWRVAFALQADGWYLRSEIIWHKGNPLPESVVDRPTRAHEQVFLLTKRARYFYDAEAIAEPVSGDAHPRGAGVHPKSLLWEDAFGQASANATRLHRPRQHSHFAGAVRDLVERRNRRSVWLVRLAGYRGAHFATFPPALVEPCVRAGTSERGCCPACGAPWRRIVERRRVERNELPEGDPRRRPRRYDAGKGATLYGPGHSGQRYVVSRTIGWRPGCACPPHTPVPCTVLDPCSGAGTTGLVADRLGREALLIELRTEYVALAWQRVVGDAPLFADVVDAGRDEECAG